MPPLFTIVGCANLREFSQPERRLLNGNMRKYRAAEWISRSRRIYSEGSKMNGRFIERRENRRGMERARSRLRAKLNFDRCCIGLKLTIQMYLYVVKAERCYCYGQWRWTIWNYDFEYMHIRFIAEECFVILVFTEYRQCQLFVSLCFVMFFALVCISDKQKKTWRFSVFL